MKIGEHEVTNITRDSAKVGCQVVSRSEVQSLLASMNDAPYRLILKATGSDSTTPGSVYLKPIGDGQRVRVYLRNKNGDEYYLLDIVASEGIRLAEGCRNTGLPVDEEGVGYNTVKIAGKC